MIAEVIIIFAIFLGGCALTRTLDIQGWPLPALGFIVGVLLYIVIGTLQVIIGLPTNPIITLTLTFSMPFVWWFGSLKQGRDVSIKWQPALICCVVLIALIVSLREANLVNYHTDSFRYLMTGTLLADNNYYAVTLNLLTKRLLALPIIHASANLQGEVYLRSFATLLAISTIMIFYWFLYLGVKNKISNDYYLLFSIGGIFLLLSNNRFVFNAFYLNAHLLFATLLMIIAGCSWLLTRCHYNKSKALIMVQILAIPVLIVARPEGFIFAGLALLPFFIVEKISWIHRTLIIGVFSISVTTWHSYLAIAFIKRGSDIPLYVIVPLLLGIVSFLMIPLLRWKYFKKYSPSLPVLIEIGLWLALLIFSITKPRIIYQSLNATLENVFFDAGSWGLSLAAIALLVFGVLIFTNAPDRLFLRYPLTTFLPVSFLLAYLRGGAYRVGDFDSLNRSLIHIVPLAILFIVSAVESEHWGLPEWCKTFFAKIKANLKLIQIKLLPPSSDH